MISSGRLAKLEGELALQKSLTEQMKQNQLEVSFTLKGKSSKILIISAFFHRSDHVTHAGLYLFVFLKLFHVADKIV